MMPADSQGRTVSFVTLGCKVNQYDTQAIRERLLARGYREVPADRAADVCVINTCTVTAVSDSKSRKYIRRAARLNPHSVIVVTGCCVDSYADLAGKLRGSVGEARLLLVPNDSKPQIAELLEAGGQQGPAPTTEAGGRQGPVPAGEAGAEPGNSWSLGISSLERHTRAFVKIQDGCNNFCSYCIVPHVRGRVRSRPLPSIVAEVERLVDAGCPEIVLTGIHVGQYGRETGGADLADVVETLGRLRGVVRLRLSSIEAMEVTDRLIELAAAGVLCPHFHLPLQSGSDRILQLMNRRYTSREFIGVVQRIAARIDRPSITSDVMIGFPGETAADFLATQETCRAAGFSRTHIFPFSPRPGTPAAAMPGRCSPGTLAGRKQQLQEIARETALAYRRRFIGERADVLVEGDTDDTGLACGHTDRYIKVVLHGAGAAPGRCVAARLTEIRRDGMHGEIEGVL